MYLAIVKKRILLTKRWFYKVTSILITVENNIHPKEANVRPGEYSVHLLIYSLVEQLH